MSKHPTTPHPAEALVLARVSAAVRERAAAVQLMVFDVDGILTDGGLYYGEQGEALKRFNVLDGQGMRLLANHGVTVALMTARDSAMVTRRAADLGISEVTQAVKDKARALLELSQRLGVSLEETGFMGDDINDLAALRQVGFAATVPSAPSYVAQVAHWTSERAGGHGAVRECCDLILAAKGRLGLALSSGYQAPTSGSPQ